MKSNYKGVTLTSGGHIWKNGKFISASGDSSSARSKTIAYGILAAHNDGGKLPEEMTDFGFTLTRLLRMI